MFGSKKADDDVPATAPAAGGPTFGREGYYDGFAPDAGAAEKAGQPTHGGGRKMSRIDRPITGSIAGAGVIDDDMTGASISVGKQMELEAGNSIKYRTCSWYKV